MLGLKLNPVSIEKDPQDSSPDLSVGQGYLHAHKEGPEGRKHI